MDNIEGFLGIAKKARKLETGEQCVADAARLSRARLIMSASDASDKSKRHAGALAEECGAVYAELPYSKADLGAAVGRGEPGMLAITDVGIAEGLVSRLAQSEPERYGPAAERLKLKQKRMTERRQSAPRSGGRTTGKRRTGK